MIDINSGKEIGTIAGIFDEIFVLARRTWRIVSISGGIISVRGFNGKASAPLFQRNRNAGAFYYLLPSDLKNRIGSEF